MSTLEKIDIRWCQEIYKLHKRLCPEDVDCIYEMAYSSIYDHTRRGCSCPDTLTALLFPNHECYGNWAFFKNGNYVCSLAVDILEGDTTDLDPS